MRKAFIFGLFLIFFFIFTVNIAEAASLGRPFGGRIDLVEAWEVQTLVDAGFICSMSGTTFDILPNGKVSPRGPYLVSFSTKGEPRSGRWILGLYTPGVIATCTNPETKATVSVQGFIVSIYAMSKI